MLLHRSCSTFAFCCVFLPPMSLARILPLVCIQGKHRMMQQQLNAQDEAFVIMRHLPDNAIWITTPTDLEETALTQFSLFREFVCSQHGRKCSLVYTRPIPHFKTDFGNKRTSFFSRNCFSGQCSWSKYRIFVILPWPQQTFSVFFQLMLIHIPGRSRQDKSSFFRSNTPIDAFCSKIFWRQERKSASLFNVCSTQTGWKKRDGKMRWALDFLPAETSALSLSFSFFFWSFCVTNHPQYSVRKFAFFR